MKVSLDRIVEVENYRSTYPADHIAGLADNMRVKGYDTAYPVKLIVIAQDRKSREMVYGLVAGHCRTRAARIAGLLSVEAIILDTYDASTLMLDQLSENENRSDPNDIDRATGYKRALDAGASMDALCKATGKHTDYIQRRIDLLRLIPEAQALVAHGQIGIKYALCMVDLDTNFQNIALRAYNEGKAHSVDTFNAVCSALLEKQRTCSLFDLALFNGKPIEQIITVPDATREPSKAELVAMLIQERHAHEDSKQAARKAYQSIKAELSALRAQLDMMRIPA
jgi:ParB/RepB/Spo0J family partition protein